MALPKHWLLNERLPPVTLTPEGMVSVPAACISKTSEPLVAVASQVPDRVWLPSKATFSVELPVRITLPLSVTLFQRVRKNPLAGAMFPLRVTFDRRLLQLALNTSTPPFWLTVPLRMLPPLRIQSPVVALRFRVPPPRSIDASTVTVPPVRDTAASDASVWAPEKVAAVPLIATLPAPELVTSPLKATVALVKAMAAVLLRLPNVCVPPVRLTGALLVHVVAALMENPPALALLSVPLLVKATTWLPRVTLRPATLLRSVPLLISVMLLPKHTLPKETLPPVTLTPEGMVSVPAVCISSTSVPVLAEVSHVPERVWLPSKATLTEAFPVGATDPLRVTLFQRKRLVPVLGAMFPLIVTPTRRLLQLVSNRSVAPLRVTVPLVIAPPESVQSPVEALSVSVPVPRFAVPVTLTVPAVRLKVPRLVGLKVPPRFTVPLVDVSVPALLHAPSRVSVPPLTVMLPVAALVNVPALVVKVLPDATVTVPLLVKLVTWLPRVSVRLVPLTPSVPLLISVMALPKHTLPKETLPPVTLTPEGIVSVPAVCISSVIVPVVPVLSHVPESVWLPSKATFTEALPVGATEPLSVTLFQRKRLVPVLGAMFPLIVTPTRRLLQLVSNRSVAPLRVTVPLVIAPPESVQSPVEALSVSVPVPRFAVPVTLTVPAVRLKVPRLVGLKVPPRFTVPLVDVSVPALLHAPSRVSVPPLTVMLPVAALVNVPALVVKVLPDATVTVPLLVKLVTWLPRVSVRLVPLTPSVPLLISVMALPKHTLPKETLPPVTLTPEGIVSVPAVCISSVIVPVVPVLSHVPESVWLPSKATFTEALPVGATEPLSVTLFQRKRIVPELGVTLPLSVRFTRRLAQLVSASNRAVPVSVQVPPCSTPLLSSEIDRAEFTVAAVAVIPETRTVPAPAGITTSFTAVGTVAGDQLAA